MDSLSPHGIRATYQPSRRGFLIAMMGAGVMLGYAGPASPPWNSSARDQELPWTGAALGELFEPTIWYGIDPSGAVTVNIIRAEMGQHVGTALARIVADELEADWGKVRIVDVDTDPKWGVMVTGGSWSVWQSFPVLSRAGAAGRIALVEEGAKLLGVSPQSCTARNGAVQAKGRSISLWRYRGAWRSPADLHTRTAGRNSDQGAGQTPLDRARYDGARCSVEDQRQGSLWHRRGGGRHDLRPSQSSTHPLRLQGGLDRRFRGEGRAGLHSEPCPG